MRLRAAQADCRREQAQWRARGIDATFTHVVVVTPSAPRDRPRCGARCRDGHACLAPVVWPDGAWRPRRRCRNHGGMSTGPRTEEGKRRAAAASRQRMVDRWRLVREAEEEPAKT